MSNSPSDSRFRSKWPAIAIVVMVFLFALVLIQRQTILAHWWVYRLRQTTSLAERSFYIACLADVGDDAEGALAWLARDDRAELRGLVIPASQGLSSVGRFNVLTRRFADDNDDVRRSAATALAFMKKTPALNYLLGQSSSPDPRIATAALAALARMDSPEAREAICQAILSGAAPAIRAQAVESMAYYFRDIAIPTSQAGAAEAHATDCDPVVSLVSALTDSGSYVGRLALEREIDAVAKAVIAVKRMPVETSPTSRPGNLERTVAQIAVATLSTLTGHTIQPRASMTTDEKKSFVKQCQSWMAERRSH